MKTLCCIGVCLMLAGAAASQEQEAGLDERLAQAREAYKDPEKLKATLMRIFAIDDRVLDPRKEIPIFKQKYHVSDETMRTALMSIYESVRHLGDDPAHSDEPRETIYDKRRLFCSLEWLGFCADGATKELLMRWATDGTKANDYRVPAIDAYIRCADAQQVRDALIRFLIDMRVDPYGTYLQAFAVYDESDVQKREAITASLVVALSREEDKGRFADMDKKLAKRSKEYAESSQRKAMVERMSKLPPGLYRDTDPDLKAALESFKALPKLTSVSTNLTELMARDFRKPPEKKE